MDCIINIYSNIFLNNKFIKKNIIKILYKNL